MSNDIVSHGVASNDIGPDETMPDVRVPHDEPATRARWLRVPNRAGRCALVAALGLVFAACGPRGPRPIEYGRETCDYCRMTITDPRFGAEVATRTGKTHAFDSIECVAAYTAAQAPGEVRAVWVSDYAHPGTLVSADSATFWRAPSGTGPATPMGKGLVASTTATPPAGFTNAAGPLRWPEVLALVEREGLERGSAAHAH